MSDQDHRPTQRPPDPAGDAQTATRAVCEALWLLDAPSQARSLRQAAQELSDGLDTSGQIKAICARLGERLAETLQRSL